jgi:carbamoyl-phosphate synthase large subunit
MRSTGEVMGLVRNFNRAFLKAQIGASATLPEGGTAFVSVKDADKEQTVETVQKLVANGFSILATGGTATFLAERGVTVERVNKVLEGQPHIVDRMKDGAVQMVINTTEGAEAIRDSFDIRATALKLKTPYFTTASGAAAAAAAIDNLRDGALAVAPLQSYFRS